MDTPILWWGSIKNKPRHLAELACRLFSISPSQASCERNFSILKWMIGDKRISLSVDNLENMAMAKVRSYHMTNIKSELNDYGKELTETELREAVTISAVAEIMASEEESSDLEEVFDNTEHVQDSLLINEIVDLFQYDIENEIISTRYDTGNMEYSPEQLVDEFLAEESALVENYLNNL